MAGCVFGRGRGAPEGLQGTGPSQEEAQSFLKEPWFMASSIYLQGEKRVMTLLMALALCLLVYSALEWRIREGLQASGLAFPDQKGNPTQRPTARWVFQAFHGIHLLLVRYEKLYASRPP